MWRILIAVRSPTLTNGACLWTKQNTLWGFCCEKSDRVFLQAQLLHTRKKAPVHSFTTTPQCFMRAAVQLKPITEHYQNGLVPIYAGERIGWAIVFSLVHFSLRLASNSSNCKLARLILPKLKLVPCWQCCSWSIRLSSTCGKRSAATKCSSCQSGTQPFRWLPSAWKHNLMYI